VSQSEISPLEECLAQFLTTASEMMSRDEYLFPYLWAQRQFREDRYQMSSAAELEDLFFDTMGSFIRQQDPGAAFSRRQGREPWDYMFFGQKLSHKEGKAPVFTAVWQPGEGQGNKTLRYETWDFEHPIVFMYTPKFVKAKCVTSLSTKTGEARDGWRELWHVSHDSLAHAAVQDAPVLYGELVDTHITVDRIWTGADWRALRVHDLRTVVGQPRPQAKDFWLGKSDAKLRLKPLDLAEVVLPFDVEIEAQPLMPGMYVFPESQLSKVPLTSNNKAHFVAKPKVEQLMREAVRSGNFVPMPLWPMEFADVTPPNLYAQQRRRYDEYMAARSKGA